MYLRLKHDALSTLLPHHAHYVSCSHFVLFVSILFVKFVVAEICFLFFPFELQNMLSADVEFGGNVVLINNFFVRCEYLNYEGVLIIP